MLLLGSSWLGGGFTLSCQFPGNQVTGDFQGVFVRFAGDPILSVDDDGRGGIDAGALRELTGAIDFRRYRGAVHDFQELGAIDPQAGV